MKIRTILDSIDLGNMALPEFQRGYVWNRDQVRGLMQSLYRRYPVGSLLGPSTHRVPAGVRGEEPGRARFPLDPHGPRDVVDRAISRLLAARRDLLAQAANDFLDSLVKGEVPDIPVQTAPLERERAVVPAVTVGEDEERVLTETNEWIRRLGLPKGELLYEITDPESGEPLAVLDLAWPDGLQEGYSQPVTVLLDGDPELEDVVNTAGFHFFTNVEEFRRYVRQEILAGDPDEIPTAFV
jgi:hypothetical protein